MIRHLARQLFVIFALSLGFASLPALADNAKAQLETPKVMLRISADGKAIVDESGKEVARFNKDVKVNPMMNVSDRLPGCMRCQPECVVYEGERCVKWIRSCTWDFDCK
ncbi:hypothetical protein EDC61_106106 [Sulfuritortus calidifontis]|uniref:Uncharacterized protein n=1 Tax=Sulfuritortus calidifontis TaxID=1914471 RepID=A0A4R3JVS1_9PROT|nr:hypothetical protein [Sulfuritortus calidifontis]TCS72191.1 hypothetical protein EDC61_106106 [Sulfuritortus calidifontis]